MIEYYKIDPELEQRVRETLRCSYELIEQSRRLVQRSRALLHDYALSNGRVTVKKDSRPAQAD
jgi:hypothetical protein